MHALTQALYNSRLTEHIAVLGWKEYPLNQPKLFTLFSFPLRNTNLLYICSFPSPLTLYFPWTAQTLSQATRSVAEMTTTRQH